MKQGKFNNNENDVQSKNTCKHPFPLSQDCIGFQSIVFPRLGALPSTADNT